MMWTIPVRKRGPRPKRVSVAPRGWWPTMKEERKMMKRKNHAVERQVSKKAATIQTKEFPNEEQSDEQKLGGWRAH